MPQESDCLRANSTGCIKNSFAWPDSKFLKKPGKRRALRGDGMLPIAVDQVIVGCELVIERRSDELCGGV